MPVYSLARAATEAHRSRSTLLRAIQTGRLSATRDPPSGAWAIDAAELHRVYPPGGDGHGEGHAGTAADDRGDSAAVIAAKDALIAEQRAMLDDLRRRLDTEAEERRRLTMVLADMRTAPASPRRRGWWRWG
jgi:hypothetical protein